jgi:hypothetical protein
MIAEIKSLMNKRLDLCGLMVVFLIIILLAAHQQAQANSGNLGGDIDDEIDSYQQGNADGRSAGLVDYPYRNIDCPVVGHSTAYCLGWSGGYETGFNAKKTIDESARQSDSSDDNDNDDDDE